MKFLYIVVIVLNFISVAYSSWGDQSQIYQDCIRECFSNECHGTQSGFLPHYPAMYRLLQWSCIDECKYNCMWHTVEEYDRLLDPNETRRIPQFHGKWPFVRFYGIQEPASCIFSVFNALAHLVMLAYFVRYANRDYDLFYMVVACALVNIHGWTWSSIFHSRDVPFTEKMDYFCALGIILSNVLMAVLRIIGFSQLKLGGVLAPLLAVYFRHIYLMNQHFDYGYNMKVSITFVAIGAGLWIIHGSYAYFVLKHKHARLSMMVWILLTVAGLLEVFDFAPIAWTFDAHALWHAATVPMTFVWYNFLIQDSFISLEQPSKQKQSEFDPAVNLQTTAVKN